MKGKKLTFLLMLLATVLFFNACENGQPSVSDVTTNAEHVETQPATNENAETQCAHRYELTETVGELALSDRRERYTCAVCGDVYWETVPNTATKSVKILAIGNSFSKDAMQYLWHVCKNGGVEQIVLGNLYIGGAGLSTHWSNINGDKAAYEYHKNTDGNWNVTQGIKASDILKEEAWDVIVIQQSPEASGDPETYAALSRLLPYLEANKPKANTPIVFHMTWAFQGNSDHSGFPFYNNDQMLMYNSIVESVEQEVLTRKEICGVIPSGTAIQNLRTSYVGDTVTRDGYHMSYDFGRYTLALTWFAYFTGGELSLVSWVPTEHAHLRSSLDVIFESVENAIKEPLKVTQSQYVVKQ
ncbi:MAG: DUF4886 domain-containing protein [Ruminococcaceae bacterium]|nr:DUF4886 domain-containing protein [Oscillospiraceae bacterium]